MLHLNKVLSIRNRFDLLFVSLQPNPGTTCQARFSGSDLVTNFSTHLMPLVKVIVLSAC